MNRFKPPDNYVINNAALVRPVKINNQIVLGSRSQTVKEITEWFKQLHQENVADSDVSVLSLLDKQNGKTIAETIRGFYISETDLPMFLSEFSRGEDETLEGVFKL